MPKKAVFIYLSKCINLNVWSSQVQSALANLSAPAQVAPYSNRCHNENGLAELREEIEAENEGVIPLFLMRWVRAKRAIDEHFQRGRLPLGEASVVFKVPNKEAGRALLKEMWVVGSHARVRYHEYLHSPTQSFPYWITYVSGDSLSYWLPTWLLRAAHGYAG